MAYKLTLPALNVTVTHDRIDVLRKVAQDYNELMNVLLDLESIKTYEAPLLESTDNGPKGWSVADG